MTLEIQVLVPNPPLLITGTPMEIYVQTNNKNLYRFASTQKDHKLLQK